MKCANCAKDNPTGARYCIHCGAEQAVPTPIAAVAAAAMASGRRAPLRQAANAAQAEPLLDAGVEKEAVPARWQPIASEATAAGARVAASPGGERPIAATADARTPVSPDASPASPAYAALPPRKGVAAALVAACVVVAAIAFTIVHYVQSNTSTTDATADAGESVMSSFPPDATPSRSRRPPTGVAASNAPTAPNADATAKAASSSSPSAAPQPGESIAQPQPIDRTRDARPVEIRPLPARPAPRTTTRHAGPEKSAESPAATQPSASPPPPAPAVVAAAPKASAARAADPWARVRDELSRCTREDFIARVICDQRVRFRYCKDYWGKVPECPGNPPAEQGQ